MPSLQMTRIACNDCTHKLMVLVCSLTDILPLILTPSILRDVTLAVLVMVVVHSLDAYSCHE